jgi:hypothetical protein
MPKVAGIQTYHLFIKSESNNALDISAYTRKQFPDRQTINLTL